LERSQAFCWQYPVGTEHSAGARKECGDSELRFGGQNVVFIIQNRNASHADVLVCG